jgi:hypothetical protein
MIKQQRKLEAILELMDYYFIDYDTTDNEMISRNFIELLADNYELVGIYSEAIDIIIRRSMELLDNFCSEPKKENYHVAELFEIIGG